MQKRKNSWAAFVGGGNKKGEKMTGENARILPKATHEERKKQEAKRKGKLKTVAGKLLKTVVGGKETVQKAGAEDVAGNLLKRPSSRKGEERGTPAEETICRFIEQGKFLEACDQIHNLEHSGDDGMGKSESLYVLLAERMWTVVGEALSGGDRMLLEPLQSVGESLKWEKQKEAERLGNSLETDSVSTWSPNFWKKDLEEKLMQYMTAQIPLLDSSTDTNETALKQHLSHLERTFVPSLEHRSDVFREAGLLVTYARCCHASLCSHLATLTDRNCFSFSQSLLIYEWIIKMYKRGSQACERPGHSLSLGAQCLVWILWKTEEKLLATARILTEKTEAARRVSESLGEKVEAECLEECLRFLESYEDEVRSFIQLDGCSQIYSSLRILESCCLLRAVWHKLTYICSVSTEQNVKVNGFLHRMEDDIMEHFLQTITTKVKGTLKDHFKKCDSGFDHVLESLKQSFLTFGKKKTDIYEALVKAVNAIIVTEYMQALLTTPRKTSAMQRRRIANKIEEDHRMMQTIFKECLGPAAGSLKDPIKAILELVQTSDPEGMKIALLPILKEFPDLRKEHLSAVLDIKDSLSRDDRAALLKAFHDNCRESETEANLLFADIEVKPRKCGLCGCLCC
ncbi:exocyst complex component 3 isoform X2 [Zonotrichia albicollis]|uniref:exocyst complex component 3 isoform X2 n=1 Tax=Zonotrichia albicollis TaxID=44394 RepID=UPI003D80DF6B